jgi:acyl carrier protein
MNLFDSVINIVATQLHVSPNKIFKSTNFVTDLGADSLDLIELVMTFEEKFKIQITEEEAQHLDNVGRVVNYLRYKLNVNNFSTMILRRGQIYVNEFGEIFDE